MLKIAPSILSANFAKLGDEIKKLNQSGADLVHFDVMDGHFVPNITFGPMILKNIKKLSTLPFDVHLMVNEPDKFIPWYAAAGADIITFHIEATENPLHEIELIKSLGKKVGMSIKPHTDIRFLEPYLEKLDLVLLMSVEPGFGGQEFSPNAVERIKNLKKMIDCKKTLIEVDGGINPVTAKLCIESGADILVAGSAIFNNVDYAGNISKLRSC